MRERMVHILIIAYTLLCIGCTSGEEFDSSLFTQTLYAPQYASGFEIRSTDDGTASIIVCHSPWQGAEGVTQTLLIDPENRFSNTNSSSLQRIEGNAKRVVCMSSSYVAMLSRVDCNDAIVGVSGKDFITNEYVVNNSDKIGDVGYDNNIDYELLVALDPDIVLLYGVNAASAMEIKLQELGIPYTYIGEYLESSPLGKAEWMVAIAHIVGCREKGVEVFSPIPERYNRLKEIAASSATRPKVMINTPYGDNWYMPSTQSYMARLIADAAGDYLYDRDTDNTSAIIDNEQAYMLVSSAERWINVGQLRSLEELKSRYPKLADITCVEEKQVYNCVKRQTPTGGNDFWESGVVHPDVILSDLIKIFHPALPFSLQDESPISGTDLHYYIKLE